MKPCKECGYEEGWLTGPQALEPLVQETDEIRQRQIDGDERHSLNIAADPERKLKWNVKL